MTQPNVDFKIFSNAVTPMDLLDSVGTKRPQIRGIGSSECKDLAGDVVTRDALNDIVEKMGVNTAVCLNHEYRTPEDIFGGLARKPELKRFKGSKHGLMRPVEEFAAVELVVNVNRANPRALLAYKTIDEEEIQLGLSIGFNITDYEIIKEAKTGIPTGFMIQHLDPLEESLVTIPCNQQSWVTATGEFLETKSVTFDMLEKGFVTYNPPPYQTTDTNWPAAAAKGLFKRYGMAAKWENIGPTDMLYALKHYQDFDDVEALYLKQLDTVLRRWGLAIGRLPIEN